MTNEGDEAEDAPPAIPDWEPSEIAKQIANGHAARVHFANSEVEEVALLVHRVIRDGMSKTFGVRTLYWDPESAVAVIVNPRDQDGGTAFPSNAEYFEDWGN